MSTNLRASVLGLALLCGAAVAEPPAVDAAPVSPPWAAPPIDRAVTVLDGRTGAVVSFEAMLDAAFQLWFFVAMCAVLGIEPTPELFSAFTKMSVTYNPTVEIGWEKHAGDDYVLGTTSEAYILDDGTVLIATGLFPTGDYQLDIEVQFGSWEDESGSPTFGDASFVIDSESVGSGDDPFVYFGAEPVYDLVAGE